MNDVNDTVYEVLGDGTNAPATAAAVRTNIGLGSIATQDSTNVTITGGSINSSTLSGAITVANGGTGVTTTTAYSPVITGTTPTGAFNVSLGPGTAGQLLVSNGAGVAPSWGSSSVPDATDTVKGIVELATVAETQTGTDTVRAVTPAGVAGVALGVGQTWQTVTRTHGVNYTNSTGKPIGITYTVVGNGSHTLTIDGVLVISAVDVAGVAGIGTSIIPNGAVYTTGGTGTEQWIELR